MALPTPAGDYCAPALLAALYEHCSTFADLAIRCSDGVILHAHRAVLSAREPYFARRFSRCATSERCTFTVRDCPARCEHQPLPVPALAT